MGPAPLGGSCERGKVSTHGEVPSLSGSLVRAEGELQSLRGECGNSFAEGKAEKDLHRKPVLTGTPQPGMLVHWGQQELGAESSTLEVRPWGEN